MPYTDAELLDAIHPLVNLLNGQYLVVPRGLALVPPAIAFHSLGKRTTIAFTRNSACTALVLFGITHRSLPMRTACELLRSDQIDPSAVALVEEALPFELTNPDVTSTDRVEVIGHNPPGVYSSANASENARLLVVSENYQSNWSVWVDGQPADMLRVNYVWKGVITPRRNHRVEFRYRSSILFWSRTATILCALFVVGLIAADRMRRR